MKIISHTFLLIALFVQSGCITLLPDSGPAPRKIILDPSMISSPLRGKGTLNIAVSKPLAPSRYDTNRLSIRYEDKKNQELMLTDYMSGVIIQDVLPPLMQHHLVSALTISKKFRAVGFSQESFKRDVIIESVIEAFDVVVEKDKIYADVTLNVKLLSAKGRKALWQKKFSATSPISKHSISAFIAGLTVAYEDVIYQITQENY